MTAVEQKIATHHRAAQQAIQDGQMREAHQQCLASLALDQAFADAWFLCGVIAAHNGVPAQAADIVRKAITLAPGKAEYHAELGKLLIALRQPR
ncbi:MAG TPA: hypothetical protein VIV27_06125, partial [Halioglobus sp.]